MKLFTFIPAVSALVALLVTSSPPLVAGGPTGADGTIARRYSASAFPLTYKYDQGNLGVFTNSQAAALVTYGFSQWDGVSTAALAFVNGGQLPRDVTSASDPLISGPLQFSDGVNPVIFDSDGSIMDARLGAGASNTLLGLAGSSYDGTQYVEGYVIINGKLAGNIANDSVTYRQTLTHEIGHFLGLTHSQVAIHGIFATMYPAPVRPDIQSVLTPDDIAAISQLYPADGYVQTVGSISGTVTFPDGTPARGLNILAVNTINGASYSTVVDYYSGGASTYQNPPESSGSYSIGGLPPGEYCVRIEPIGGISGAFTGPGRIASYDAGAPQNTRGLMSEWYNGPDESGDLLTDDINRKTPVTVKAGAVTGGIGIVVNQTASTLTSMWYYDALAYSYQVTGSKQYAMRFTAPSDGSLVALVFPAPASSTLAMDGQLLVTVYRDNAGLPGTVLGVVTVPFADLVSDRDNSIGLRGLGLKGQFKSGEDFHIGISMTGGGALHILSDVGGAGTHGSRSSGGGAWNSVNYNFVMSAVYTDAPASGGSGVENPAMQAEKIPSDALLSQNTPNPFSTRTSIGYVLRQREHVTLDLYAVNGRKVRTLSEGTQNAGAYSVLLEGRDLPPGMYFYTLRAGSYSASRELIRLK